MSIKKLIPFLLSLLLVVVGCGNNQSNITWNTFTSQDKSYTVEVPSDFALHSNEISGWMAFQKSSNNSSDAAFITIKPVSDGFSLFDKDLRSNPKFQYDVYKKTGKTKFAECSKGMWSAVQLGMLKEIDGVQYLITLSAQGPRSNSEAIIDHIYDSMEGGTPTTSTKNQDNADAKFATYSNPHLSISYPKDWTMIKNPNQMSDVYLGTTDGSLGVTIVRFDTNASFNEIVQGAKDGADAGGMRTTSSENLTINGMRSNRMVNEFEYNGISVKTIAYTFKQGKTLYSIKFGTQKQHVDANIDLIEKIIGTFNVK